MNEEELRPLSVIEAGRTVELARASLNGKSGLRMRELGLNPRVRITVLQSSPGQPMLIRVRGSRLAIDQSVASELIVRPLD